MELAYAQQVKWVCVGVAGVAFVIAYHKWYTRKMLRIFDREMILPHYQILEHHGLDYGSSLADTYFHGYIELILPPSLEPSGNPGFVKRVENYKREQQLQKEVFPNKLFVIVHKTGFSPNTYDEHPRFRSRRKMEFEVDGRNGIRKRSYQTSVYEVISFDKKERITVVMEGAPCLRQLYEASRNSEGEALRKMSDTIISTFMKKMREKIENHAECRGLCELIYVDDSPGSETTGRGGMDWLANKLFELEALDKSRHFQ